MKNEREGRAKRSESIDGDPPADSGTGPTASDDGPEIGRASVAHSTKWSLGSLIARQGVRIVFTVILAKLLGPTNFGIVGQAAIYVAFAVVTVDFGLGAALIQRQDLDRGVKGTATLVSLGVASVLVPFTLIFADTWAAIFDTPELADVLRVLSLTFVFNALTVVPSAILIRRLDYRRIGIAQVTSSTIGGIAGVASAINGAEYWALVIQMLVRDAAYLLILLVFTGWPIVVWSTDVFRSMVRMSRNVYGSQFLGFFTSRIDDFLVAWRLGAVPLANYAMSYRILQMAMEALGQTANRMILPVFSRLQGEPARQARYYLSAISSLSLVVVPAMVIVALTAPTVIPVVFGPDWEGAIRPTQILSIVSILTTLMTVNSSVLIANNRPEWLFRYSLVVAAVMPFAVVIGLQFGIVGVSWAALLVGFPLGFASVYLTSRVIPISARSYTRAVAPALVGAVAMVVVWGLGASELDSWYGGLGGLGVKLIVMAGVFAGVVWLGWRDLFHEQVRFVRAMIGRDPSKAERIR